MLIYKSEDYIDKSMPFGISKGFCSYDHNIHMHDFIELVYIISGTGTHFIDDSKFHVRKGDILFINYNQTHKFSASKSMEYINFYIKPEYISEKLADAKTIYDIFSFFILDKHFDDTEARVPLLSFPISDMREIENIIDAIIKEYDAKEPDYELMLDGYMRIIFAKIIRTLRTSRKTELYTDIISELLEYIDRNYTKPLTLADLANQCFYNPAYLGRIFKNTFGMSLHEYICDKRISYACRLLEETDETVENISSNVGYSEKTHFYKIFRKKTGCTPKQYRENIKNRQK